MAIGYLFTSLAIFLSMVANRHREKEAFLVALFWLPLLFISVGLVALVVIFNAFTDEG